MTGHWSTIINFNCIKYMQGYGHLRASYLHLSLRHNTYILWCSEMLCTRMFIVNMKLKTKPPILPHKYYICNMSVLNITHHMLLQMTCLKAEQE